jgi:hypothetical protein
MKNVTYLNFSRFIFLQDRIKLVLGTSTWSRLRPKIFSGSRPRMGRDQKKHPIANQTRSRPKLKDRVEIILYFIFLSNHWLSKRTCPKILKICQITKFDMSFQKINIRTRSEKVDFFYWVIFSDSCT